MLCLQYVFPTPDEIKSREQFVDDSWASLAAAHSTKLAKLQDDLAREQFKEKLRTQNKQVGSWPI